MTTTPFDPSALRERYRAARDKQLHADGNRQYVEVTGRFARYLQMLEAWRARGDRAGLELS